MNPFARFALGTAGASTGPAAPQQQRTIPAAHGAGDGDGGATTARVKVELAFEASDDQPPPQRRSTSDRPDVKTAALKADDPIAAQTQTSSTGPTSFIASSSSPSSSETRVKQLDLLIAHRHHETASPAPIDLYGTQACVCPRAESPTVRRFQILIAALLSSQTQDPITHAAMQRLHDDFYDGGGDDDGARSTNNTMDTNDEGFTISKARRMDTARLQELLVPVGFYRRKAQQIKRIAETLRATGDIPRNLDGLETLPGIGPKIARVILLLAWGDVGSGLIVDTHVHRIAQRLGWVAHAPMPVMGAEDTRRALEEWVPRSYWREFSREVVGFGQTVCVAVYPRCLDCPLAPMCPSAFTYRHPSSSRAKRTRTSATATVTATSNPTKKTKKRLNSVADEPPGSMNDERSTLSNELPDEVISPDRPTTGYDDDDGVV